MFSSKPLFLLIAIAQFFVPVLPQLGIGTSLGKRAVEQGIPPELPPGAFFSIWGIIFSGLVLIAVVNLRQQSHVGDRLVPPLMIASLGNIIWMLSAQSLGLVWLDFLLLLPIGFFTWEAAYRLDQTSGYDGTLQSFLYGVTVGLFAGWLTVAISISVPDLGRWILGLGVTDRVWASLWMTLVPAVGMAYVFANYVSRNGWYFIALGWGLLGVIINNWTRTEMHALALMTAVIGAYLIFRRVRFGARGSYPAKP